MAIKLTAHQYYEMQLQAQQQGEPIWQPLDLGIQTHLPQQLGKGSDCIFNLRNGLNVGIRQGQLKQAFHYTTQNNSSFPLNSKFYLSGTSRLQTRESLHVTPVYEENEGHHYLYHLPNQTEIEEWPADEPIQAVRLWADPSYFSSFDTRQTALSPALQRLLEGDRSQRFHQPLGPINAAIKLLLLQILHCPYTGLMQQLYLESKALELFAAQFGLWAEVPSTATTALSAHDIEQLHQAREILMQQVAHPPSLLDLARQVGVNDYKLKRGFRELFGTSAFDYLRNYRLQQAQLLLQNPNLTIASVAAKVGYGSPEGFCKAFRRQFGISPKAYQSSQRS